MNITGGGKVTLNPKNNQERTALFVLADITGNETLRAHLKQFTQGHFKGKTDVMDMTGDDYAYKCSVLDFVSKSTDLYEPLALVFKYRKDNMPDA